MSEITFSLEQQEILRENSGCQINRPLSNEEIIRQQQAKIQLLDEQISMWIKKR